MKEIYDIITKKIIKINNRELTKKCKEINVDYTAVSHLFREFTLHINGRYILPKNKDKIFTLVDLDTGKEYDCIKPKSIFLYFNCPINLRETQSISGLITKRQILGKACNKAFYLKSNGYPTKLRIRKSTNHNSDKIKEIIIQRKIRKQIRNRLAHRISNCLKSKFLKKMNFTEKIIGCKIQFFLGYLESKFTKGMTWENRSDWHIDHIIPCNQFNLIDIKEQYKCFHYTNLRPLWITREIAMKYGENENYVGNLNRNREGTN
jgi:hypothetical protein